MRAGFKKLQQLWKHSNISTAWKKHVYMSTCVPVLMYGMESATLTAADRQKLDSIHCSCLKQILNIKSTYYTEHLDQTATTVSNSTILQLADLPPLTALITKQQTKLFGHILRAEPTSIERNVCFTTAFNYRAAKDTVKKRVGGPKEHWVEQTAHSLYLTLPFPPQTPFILPSFYLQLKRLAADRSQWHQIVHCPRVVGSISDTDCTGYKTTKRRLP